MCIAYSGHISFCSRSYKPLTSIRGVERQTVSIIMRAASSGKRNVTVYRPSIRLSVCPVFLTLVKRAAYTHHDSPGAACNAAGAHFGPTISRMLLKRSFGPRLRLL